MANKIKQVVTSIVGGSPSTAAWFIREHLQQQSNKQKGNNRTASKTKET